MSASTFGWLGLGVMATALVLVLVLAVIETGRR